MPRKPDLLNAREYIKYVIMIAEGYEKYGKCGAIDHEMRKVRLIGNAILRKNDAAREKGQRKDIYVEAEKCE